MWVVRRIFQGVADGAGLYHIKRALEAEAVPSPSGGRRWSRSTLRDFVRKDAYLPHTFAEVSALVAPGVAAQLDPERSYGVAWASRHDWKVLGRERRPDGTYRDVREHTEKPREEWIALPMRASRGRSPKGRGGTWSSGSPRRRRTGVFGSFRAGSRCAPSAGAASPVARWRRKAASGGRTTTTSARGRASRRGGRAARIGSIVPKTWRSAYATLP
jgi:hypothetical protein